MKAFMVATGEYERIAAITRHCFEWSTGVDVELVSSVADLGLGAAGNACAAKLGFCESGQHVVVDSDLLLHRKTLLPQVPEKAFAACRAELRDKNLQKAVEHYGVALRSPLLNTGLFIASAAHAESFSTAVGWMADAVSATYEETVLNLALSKHQMPVMILDQDLNRQRLTSMTSTGLHVASLVGVDAKLKEITRILSMHSPPGLKAHLKIHVPSADIFSRPELAAS